MQSGLFLETGNRQLKTYLRGLGKVLRSRSPDMVRQEIYGYSAPRGALSYSRLSREELGGRFLGLMAYLDPKD